MKLLSLELPAMIVIQLWRQGPEKEWRMAGSWHLLPCKVVCSDFFKALQVCGDNVQLLAVVGMPESTSTRFAFEARMGWEHLLQLAPVHSRSLEVRIFCWLQTCLAEIGRAHV